MIKWAIIFAIIAVVAGLLGFSGIASGAASIAKVSARSRPKRPCAFRICSQASTAPGTVTLCTELVAISFRPLPFAARVRS